MKINLKNQPLNLKKDDHKLIKNNLNFDFLNIESAVFSLSMCYR